MEKILEGITDSSQKRFPKRGDRTVGAQEHIFERIVVDRGRKSQRFCEQNSIFAFDESSSLPQCSCCRVQTKFVVGCVTVRERSSQSSCLQAVTFLPSDELSSSLSKCSCRRPRPRSSEANF